MQGAIASVDFGPWPSTDSTFFIMRSYPQQTARPDSLTNRYSVVRCIEAWDSLPEPRKHNGMRGGLIRSRAMRIKSAALANAAVAQLDLRTPRYNIVVPIHCSET